MERACTEMEVAVARFTRAMKNPYAVSRRQENMERMQRAIKRAWAMAELTHSLSGVAHDKGN